ncbi:MAG: hypothetical protein FJW27_06440 [Acidimicrobiia bacterium]|nr:hypothetical protein [Acidimicrobiia bacterium]
MPTRSPTRALPPGFVLILLAVGLFAGCAARQFDRLMRDWEGRPLAQLLTTWGPPRSVYADGKGGHVIVYLPAGEAGTSAPASPRPTPTTGPQLAAEILNGLGARPVYAAGVGAAWPVYRLFFVDQDGQIYASHWKGEWVCCGM